MLNGNIRRSIPQKTTIWSNTRDSHSGFSGFDVNENHKVFKIAKYFISIGEELEIVFSSGSEGFILTKIAWESLVYKTFIMKWGQKMFFY